MSENIKKLDSEKIENFLSRGSIFIWDSSSLYFGEFKKCIQSIFPIIQKYRNNFIVPSFVKDSLKSPEGNPAILLLDNKFFYEYPGVSDYNEFMRALKGNNITKANVMVNDREAKNSIIQAAKANGVFVFFYRIDDNGEIEEFRNVSRVRNRRSERGKETNSDYRKTSYTIKDHPERIPYKPLNIRTGLGEGEVVYDSKGAPLRLVQQETTNNNAVTYRSDNAGIWIKIFNNAALNTYTEAKIKRMVSEPLKCNGLCWPIDYVEDSDGVFRGYKLNEYQGMPLYLCVFKRAGIDANFPNWTKPDLCDLTLTILDKIEYMHRHNVLFGCINPAAIRVVDKNTVYFTDTDNYQIDGFPSMVYNISFKPPELLDKKVYLATRANENFAVAELVFMLMMPGKTPYSVGSNENPVRLIKNMHFPYSYRMGNTSLPGMWRFMWSHLGSLKGSFYNVFQKGGKFSAPEDRRDVHYWKNSIKYYEKDLRETEDKESLKIYPKTFKREPGVQFYKCNYCGVEHPRFYFDNRYFDNFKICNGCINKKSNVSFTCKACGKTYYYTNETALFHKMKKMTDSEWKDQKYCRDCKRKTRPCKSCGKEVPYFYLKNGRCRECNEVYMKTPYKMISCCDCGRQFAFTYGDYEFYMRKGYSEPTRCPDCRKRKKNGGYTSVNSYNGYSNGGNSGSDKDSGDKKKGFFGRLFNK